MRAVEKESHDGVRGRWGKQAGRQEVGRLGHFATGVAPKGGLSKGFLFKHPRPYCTCPHKAAPPHGGRARSPGAVPFSEFCPER